ncbi:MAG: aldo/keto reductase [Phycisphaerae bacterium]|nr:aldo/keto reductase [Phycisphaerae bacterium]
MRYRKFGKTDREFSALGFGTMRLPVVGGEDANVDEPAAIEMLRHAIDNGVNYVDSAYPYHGGNSERVLGKALVDGYRDKVAIATKLPPWEVKIADDFDRLLNEQLTRLGCEHIDMYLLHCMQWKWWPMLRDLGVLEWLEKAQADGRIGEVGFSFHDRVDLFKEIVDAYDWCFCQIQYNYVNEDVQAGTEGLKYASDRGLAVVIMEPLFGGSLARPGDSIAEIWSSSGLDPVDTALQWLWNKPEVSLVLSGMSTLRQVEDNIASACRSGVGSLGAEAIETVARVQAKYAEISSIPCTKCRYCMPCPSGVEIPVNFEYYNAAVMFGGVTRTLHRNLYAGLPESQRAAACTQCAECNEKCPQGIAISELMPVVHEELG